MNFKFYFFAVILFFSCSIVSCQNQDNSSLDKSPIKKELLFGDTYNENILRHDVSAPLTSLNPVEVNESGSTYIFPLLYSYLFVPDVNGKLQPDLAKSWDYDSENFIWTIHIRENAFFHNSQSVTAEDVKYTFETALKARFPIIFSSIIKIIIQSKHSLRIYLDGNNQNFPIKIWDMEIIHKPKNKKTDYYNHPIGSGPFKFEYRNGENEISLKANNDYFLGRPSLDGIIFYYQPDKEKSWTRLLAGKTDIAQEITPKNFEIIKQYEDRFYFEQRTMGFYSILLYNTRDPLFVNVNVRQAFAHAINRDYIVKNILNGYGEIAVGPLGIDSPYHNPHILPIPYNPAKAIKLLNKAGWTYNQNGRNLRKNGEIFEFTILVFEEYPIKKKVAQYIKLCLNDIGIKVYLKSLPFKKLMKRYRRNNKFQAVLTEFTDAKRRIEFLKNLWASPNLPMFNANSFEHPEVTPLLNMAILEKEPLKQIKLLQKFDTVITSLQPGSFLYHKKAINIMSKRFSLKFPFSLTHKGKFYLKYASLSEE